MSVELALMVLALVLLAIWIIRRKPRRELYQLRPMRRSVRKDSLVDVAALVTWFW